MPNANLNLMKNVLTLKQAFKVVGSSQSSPTLLKCPHFASRISTLLLNI